MKIFCSLVCFLATFFVLSAVAETTKQGADIDKFTDNGVIAASQCGDNRVAKRCSRKVSKKSRRNCRKKYHNNCMKFQDCVNNWIKSQGGTKMRKFC